MNWYQAMAWMIPTSSRVRKYCVVQADSLEHAAKRLRKLLPGYDIRDVDVNPNPVEDTDGFGIREVFPAPKKVEAAHDQLEFEQALHLVRIEQTKGEALEMVAKLADRGQITTETEEQLQDWAEKKFGEAMQ